MSSRFQNIFNARQKPSDEPTNGEAEAVPEPAAAESAPPSPAPAPTFKKKSQPKPPEPAPAGTKRLGRPPGKRTDKDYVQVTAYIRQETHRAVKVALLTGGNGQEFSELVQDLLAKWLKSRT